MADGVLRGCHVLVVEDEFMLAEDLSLELADAGAVVIGPAQTLERAIELLARPDALDVAVLDVNLQGKPVYPVADALFERKVPFVFTTGYDASILPARFRSVDCCSKPIDMGRLLEALQTAIVTARAV
ncbi:response regulator [Rhizobium leguminosarum bv. trifolii]|uniref:Response regulator n=1 Tax=Rhizobium leguminosarum bv. trifolii TaxID=386 RepID=A0A3E1B4T2_RHILT|nr:response regulator [Rhizobium leguminosarum]RFB85472.1 response regulator [Rhizobium leguminosarum bv. trifolii]RFB85598.1 response regulator [Rhizobium leguminosarum bv. trifolii]